ncbi:MAG: hypothetical protein ACOYOU_15840 [Kiritimatiellia bacterium]
MNTQSRLSKLERELALAQRRNRWAFLGISLTVLGLLTVASTNGPGMAMHDNNGKCRVAIGIKEDGSATVGLFDKDEKACVILP